MKKILIALFVLPLIFACSSDDNKELDKALIGIWRDATYSTEVDVEPSEFNDIASKWLLSMGDFHEIEIEYNISGDVTYTIVPNNISFDYTGWTKGNTLIMAQWGKIIQQAQYSVSNGCLITKQDAKKHMIKHFEEMGEKIKVNKAVLITTMKAK